MKIKRVRKKPKAWLYPSAIEREYVRFLLSIGDKITGEITRKLPEIQPHFERHLKQDGLSEILAQWLEEILVAVSAFVSNDKIKFLINKYLGEVQAFNRNQFHKALKSAYGVNIFVTEPFLMDELALFELENLRLIKSLPTQYVEQLRGKFTEAVRKGTRWEHVAKEIQRDLPDKLRNRAKLIARDQIGKLNGQLTKLRQRNIGVTHYIWRGMLDERERQLHVDREGEKLAWDNPPEDGHPGEAILCRCYAEAVFPDAEKLAEQKNVLGSDGEIKYSPTQPNWIEPKQYELHRSALQNDQAAKFITDYNLTLDEAVSLRDYTANGFITLNSALRNGHRSFKTVTMASFINQALKKLPDYKGNVIRTLSHLPENILNTYQVGEVVTERGFISSSFGFNVDNIGGYPYKFIIRSKHGKKIHKISTMDVEKEVLFKSGTQFRVINREVVNGEIRITMEEL